MSASRWTVMWPRDDEVEEIERGRLFLQARPEMAKQAFSCDNACHGSFLNFQALCQTLAIALAWPTPKKTHKAHTSKALDIITPQYHQRPAQRCLPFHLYPVCSHRWLLSPTSSCSTKRCCRTKARTRSPGSAASWWWRCFRRLGMEWSSSHWLIVWIGQKVDPTLAVRPTSS